MLSGCMLSRRKIRSDLNVEIGAEKWYIICTRKETHRAREVVQQEGVGLLKMGEVTNPRHSSCLQS